MNEKELIAAAQAWQEESENRAVIMLLVEREKEDKEHIEFRQQGIVYGQGKLLCASLEENYADRKSENAFGRLLRKAVSNVSFKHLEKFTDKLVKMVKEIEDAENNENAAEEQGKEDSHE